MKFTKKQRREIYEKAAELAFEYRMDTPGCCWAIFRSATGSEAQAQPDITNLVCTNFEEFELFKPLEYCGPFWFGNPFSSHESNINLLEEINTRTICLLLCAEMCKD
jgi:hypothetical protein